MERFKKIMKLLALICLIIMAGVGVGLTGGVPIPSSGQRNKNIDTIELVEDKKKDTDEEKDSVQLK